MNIVITEKMLGMPVFHELQDIMEKIFLKVPSISFESNDWEMFPSEVAGEEFTKKIVRVVVFNGNEEVGKLSVKRENYRNTGKQTVYRIKSPHINNRIQPKDTKTTIHPKQALNAAIKHFSRVSTPAEIIDSAKAEMSNNFSSIIYTVNRAAERIGDDHEVQLIEMAFAIHKGEQFDFSRIKKVLEYKEADKILDNSRIANSVHTDFKSDCGLVVREERDGTLTAVNLDTSLSCDSRVTRHADSYGLPELYQPKLAMLRMLDYKQPVESIGVKFSINNTNWYFLPSGEIITHS